MNDYGIDIHALRRHFVAVRDWMLACGEWTADEGDEIGQAIKLAIDPPDLGYLAWWAEWLSGWADVVKADAAGLDAMYQAALVRARADKGEA